MVTGGVLCVCACVCNFWEMRMSEWEGGDGVDEVVGGRGEKEGACV